MTKEIKENSPEKTKKKGEIDIASLLGAFTKLFAFLKQHLVLLFIVLTLSALAYAVATVNNIIQQSAPDENSSSGTYSSTFDKATIDKINALNDPNQTPNVAIPPGRINPFYE